MISRVRNPDRIEIVLQVLRKIWREKPDLRLGQILVNAGDYHMRDRGRLERASADVLFNIEDDVLVKALEEEHTGKASTIVLPR